MDTDDPEIIIKLLRQYNNTARFIAVMVFLILIFVIF